MNLDQAQNRVANFMVAGGQLDERPENYRIPDEATMDRRIAMLMEEVLELATAYEDGDIVGVADAYGDLLYVLLGGVEEAGFDIAPVFGVIAEANDKKIDWTAEPPRPFVVREDGKILKPEGWVGPEERIAHILEGAGQ